MVYKVTLWQITYPRDYKPGDGYKKKGIGTGYITEHRTRLIGWDSALWQLAARLKITGIVTNFSVCDVFGRDSGLIWFCGNI